VRYGFNATDLFGDVLSNPPTPTIQATIGNNPIFLGMAALGDYAYVIADNTIYRVSGTSPGLATVGDARWGVAVNSHDLYVLDDVNDSQASGVAVLRYSLSAVGTSQTAVELGRSVQSFNGYFGLVADEKDTYWLIGSGDQTALRLLRCSTSGCGTTPTELASVHVEFPDGWLVMDTVALYWATQEGVYRIAK
jgi:hypothetical protein